MHGIRVHDTNWWRIKQFFNRTCIKIATHSAKHNNIALNLSVDSNHLTKQNEIKSNLRDYETNRASSCSFTILINKRFSFFFICSNSLFVVKTKKFMTVIPFPLCCSCGSLLIQSSIYYILHQFMSVNWINSCHFNFLSHFVNFFPHAY